MFQILIDCSVENWRQIKFNQSSHQTRQRSCLFIHLPPIIIARSEEMPKKFFPTLSFFSSDLLILRKVLQQYKMPHVSMCRIQFVESDKEFSIPHERIHTSFL